MVWSATITGVLNQWNEMGVFSYVLPFLLIFAVVYAVLSKIKIFEDNKGVNAVIAAAIGLLSLQFDFVSTFFATIFPKFGVGLAILMFILILMGLAYQGEGKANLKWVGWVAGIGVAIWAIYSWRFWGDELGFGFWIEQNFWALIVLGVIIGAVIAVVKSGGKKAA